MTNEELEQRLTSIELNMKILGQHLHNLQRLLEEVRSQKNIDDTIDKFMGRPNE